MINISFPTSKDIYIEVNGKKLAVVESYKAKASCDSKYIEAFGESEPIGTVSGRIHHTIELSRVYACLENQNNIVNFYDLHNFNLVIVKPDKKIIYSGCEWSSINESAAVNSSILENVTLIAAKRLEVWLWIKLLDLLRFSKEKLDVK